MREAEEFGKGCFPLGGGFAGPVGVVCSYVEAWVVFFYLELVGLIPRCLSFFSAFLFL